MMAADRITLLASGPPRACTAALNIRCLLSRVCARVARPRLFPHCYLLLPLSRLPILLPFPSGLLFCAQMYSDKFSVRGLLRTIGAGRRSFAGGLPGRLRRAEHRAEPHAKPRRGCAGSRARQQRTAPRRCRWHCAVVLEAGKTVRFHCFLPSPSLWW